MDWGSGRQFGFAGLFLAIESLLWLKMDVG